MVTLFQYSINLERLPNSIPHLTTLWRSLSCGIACNIGELPLFRDLGVLKTSYHNPSFLIFGILITLVFFRWTRSSRSHHWFTQYVHKPMTFTPASASLPIIGGSPRGDAPYDKYGCVIIALWELDKQVWLPAWNIS